MSSSRTMPFSPKTCIRALVVVAAGAAAWSGAAGATTAEETPAAAAPTATPWTFRLRAEGELRHDDNVLSLSDREIDRFENDPAYAQSDRFKIESVDDFIFAPDLGFTFNRSPRQGRETSFGAALRAYEYFNDSVKSYQSYGVWLRQELNRSRAHGTVLSAGFDRTPSYYLRELIDDDESVAAGTTIRNSLDYDLNQGYLELAQEIAPRTFDATLRYVLERRNYNDHFNERDSNSTIWAVHFDIFPMQHNLFRVRPYYASEKRTSAGDIPSSPVIDDDVAFEGTLYGLELRWLWGPDSDHRRTITIWYENETRDFTTGTVTDVGHYGREDDITQYWAGYEQELGREWLLRFAYRHRNNDSSTPDPLGGTTTTAFTKNVVYASLVYRFNSPGKPAPRPRQPRERDER